MWYKTAFYPFCQKKSIGNRIFATLLVLFESEDPKLYNSSIVFIVILVGLSHIDLQQFFLNL
jgi:hypothetical protein